MIGLFDSGSGGLTILDAMRRRFTERDFLYLGDHAHAPYGHRSNQQIVEWTRSGVDYLMQQGCTLVILACNTAAAIALRHLQQTWLEDAYPGRRILGVLVPMVEAVTGLPWHSEAVNTTPSGRILLFGTRKTIQSGAYRDELAKRAPALSLYEQACPGLVDALEGGAGARPLEGLISGYVADAVDKMPGPPDSVVLGCTHFPLVEDVFRKYLPAETSVYAQPEVVADALADYLDRHSSLVAKGSGDITVLTTGNPDSPNASVGRPKTLPDFEAAEAFLRRAPE